MVDQSTRALLLVSAVDFMTEASGERRTNRQRSNVGRPITLLAERRGKTPRWPRHRLDMIDPTHKTEKQKKGGHGCLPSPKQMTYFTKAPDASTSFFASVTKTIDRADFTKGKDDMLGATAQTT